MRRGRSNRSNIEIIGDILEALSEGRGITHIMYACNLSYEQVKSYLAELQRRHMVEQVVDKKGKVIYIGAERGRQFIAALNGIQELLHGDSRKVFETYQAAQSNPLANV